MDDIKTAVLPKKAEKYLQQRRFQNLVAIVKVTVASQLLQALNFIGEDRVAALLL